MSRVHDIWLGEDRKNRVQGPHIRSIDDDLFTAEGETFMQGLERIPTRSYSDLQRSLCFESLQLHYSS